VVASRSRGCAKDTSFRGRGTGVRAEWQEQRKTPAGEQRTTARTRGSRWQSGWTIHGGDFKTSLKSATFVWQLLR